MNSQRLPASGPVLIVNLIRCYGHTEKGTHMHKDTDATYALCGKDYDTQNIQESMLKRGHYGCISTHD